MARSNNKTIAQQVAELGANIAGGSVESLIEDRGGVVLEEPETVSLVVADPTTDAEGIADAMDLIAAIFTDEVAVTDENGRVSARNTRSFLQRMMLGSVVRQLDWLIGLQNKRCDEAERFVVRASRGRHDERNGDQLAKAEAISESAVERLCELAAMRKTAAASYKEYVGQSFDAPKEEKVAAASQDTPAGRAAARKAAREAATA